MCLFRVIHLRETAGREVIAERTRAVAVGALEGCDCTADADYLGTAAASAATGEIANSCPQARRLGAPLAVPRSTASHCQIRQRSGALMRSALGSCPVSPQRPCGALRLNPVRWVKVVTLVEYLESEMREDRARSLGHPAVVIGVAPAAQREVDGPLEGAQAVEVESR